ncbi:DUF5677 domain-containing protein [Thalassobacillus sp. C254]|uniref:DUF5677 domain-containing protein n=1 Tax=Thalassobacillus sp. C254 TaxID=1225341 RepID=UPI0006D250EA|nr:DUF5677 domain-containing protein [Thalassobacillus sp. C254]
MREITQEELERFQNLENEFLSYKTKIESIMKKVQEQGAEQYDEKIYFLKSFQLLLSFIAEKGVIDHEHEEVKNIFTKVYHDLGGIISCLEQGYQVAAIPLIRVLFETTVNVKFIYQDFDKRIKIYEEAKFIEQYKRMDKHDLPEEQKVYIRKNYKRVKNNYDEYKSWYSKYFKQNFLKGTKKSANLRQLAKHVGMDMEYEELYGSFSLVSHDHQQ